MEHFHVVRWGSLLVTTGEKVPVADLDYASLATANEAAAIQHRLTSGGERCTTYLCVDSNCTLHAPRVAADLG